MNAALSEPLGIPLATARAHARLGLAVVRGLLLDLLATGDRAGVDAALEAFAGRSAGRWWERGPAGASERASYRPRWPGATTKLTAVPTAMVRLPSATAVA